MTSGDIHPSVVGYETGGHIGYIQALKDQAEQLGIIDCITFLGSVNRKRLLAYCADRDVGLPFMPPKGSDFNLKAMTGASNKAFDPQTSSAWPAAWRCWSAICRIGQRCTWNRAIVWLVTLMTLKIS